MHEWEPREHVDRGSHLTEHGFRRTNPARMLNTENGRVKFRRHSKPGTSGNDLNMMRESTQEGI